MPISFTRLDLFKLVKREPLKSVFLIAFLGSFCLYLVTAARLPVNFADSDDLTLAGIFGSFAHPPGYPLQVWLLFVWLKLSPFLEPAFAANIFAALLQSLVVGLVGVISLRLSEMLRRRTAVGWDAVGALFGSWVYAVSPLGWMYGTVIEVFPLSTLFTCLWVLSLLKLVHSKKNFFSSLAGFFGSLSLWSHQLWVPLLLVGSVLFFWKFRDRRWQGGYIFGIIAGVTVGLVLFYLQSVTVAPYGWHLQRNVEGVWNFISRNYYDVGGSQIETYVSHLDLTWSFDSALTVVSYLYQEFGLFLLFGLAAWYGLVKRKWQHGSLILGFLLVYGPLLLFYFKLPKWDTAIDTEYFWGTFFRIRMLFVFNWLVAILITMGIIEGLSKKESQVLPVKRKYVVLFLVLLGLFTTFGRFSHLNASDDNFVNEYGKKIISDLPSNSVLLTDSDMVFTFLYQQLIKLNRKDVTVLPLRIQVTSFFDDKKESHYLTASARPEKFAAHVAAWNLMQGRRVFLYSPEASVLEFIGGEGYPFYIVPKGYVLEIVTENPLPDLTYDYGLTKQVSVLQSSSDQLWESGLRGHLAEIHLQLLYYAHRWGLGQIGFIHEQLADELAETPTLKQGIRDTALGAQTRNKSHGVLTQVTALNFEDYFERGRAALEHRQFNEAYFLITRAIMVSPTSEEAYQLLLNYYYQVNDRQGIDETLDSIQKLKEYKKDQ